MAAWIDVFLTEFSVAVDWVMHLTVPVYVVVLITLIRNRNDDLFKHAFFILMANVGIADILKIFTLAFGNKLGNSGGWVPELFLWIGDSYARSTYVFNFVLDGVQITGALAIAVNRFTACVFPFRHNQIWESGRRRLLWFCIIFQWCSGVLSAAPLIPISFYGLTTTLSADNKSIGIAIFALYFIIFSTAFVKQCCHGSGESSVTERLELERAIIGLLSTLGLFISQATAALSELNYISEAPYWFFSNLGNNLLAAVPPYALLACSKSFRQRCKLMIWNGFEKVTNRITQTGTVVEKLLP